MFSVRLNKKESDEYIRLTTYEHERLEKKQKEAEEIWMRQLVEMFGIVISQLKVNKS